MKNTIQFRRTASFVLAAAMLSGLLAGCGGKNKEAGLSEYVYVPTYSDLPKEVTELNSPVLTGDTVYFSMTAYVHKDGTPATAEEAAGMSSAASATDTTTDSSNLLPRIALASVKKDGTGFAKLADYQQKQIPEGDYSYTGINKLAADAQGNIWADEEFTKTNYDLPAGFDANTQDPTEYYKGEERHIYIRKLSNTGKELMVVDLAQLVGKTAQTDDNGAPAISVSDMRIGKDGNIYIADSGMNKVYVLSGDGKLLCSLEPDQNVYINTLITFKDGGVGIVSSDQNGKSTIRQINAAGKTWGQSNELTVNISDASAGSKDYDFCYNDGSSLYGYDIAAKKNESIVTWINSDVDGNTISFCRLLDDGNIFAITGGSGDMVMEGSSAMSAETSASQ